MRGGNINSKIVAHLIKSVINSRSGKNADIAVINANSFKCFLKIAENPLCRFPSVTAKQNLHWTLHTVSGFTSITKITNNAEGDSLDKTRGESICFLADTICTKIFNLTFHGVLSLEKIIA